MNEDTSAKLFVGNLDFEVTNEELHSIFSKIGKVEDAFIVKDKETKRSRGFGFVTMGSSEEAQRAIDGLNGTDVRSRKINVSRAIKQQPN